MAPARDVEVKWRSFSLKVKNEGNDVPEQFVEPMKATHRALRVVEAVREKEGDAAVGPLYAEYGRRIHHDGQRTDFDDADVLRTVGLDPALAAAADDESYDEAIRASMKDALDVTGEDAGTPIIVFAGAQPTGYFGPIFSPAPTGEEALRVWDGLAALATASGFYELKRTRTVGPELGPRP